MPVNHAFTSAVPDSADTSLVRPVDWNNNHVVSVDLTSEVTGLLPAANIASIIGRMIYINGSDSAAIASTAVETLFDKTAAVSAGEINVARATFLILASGRLSSTGTPTMTLKLLGGPTTTDVLWDSGAQNVGASVTDRPWSVAFVVTTRTTGGSGNLNTGLIYNRIDARQSTVAGGVSSPIALTIGSVFGISATWSAASASNTITMDTFMVFRLGDV